MPDNAFVPISRNIPNWTNCPIDNKPALVHLEKNYKHILHKFPIPNERLYFYILNAWAPPEAAMLFGMQTNNPDDIWQPSTTY